jgi:hypothetical protein
MKRTYADRVFGKAAHLDHPVEPVEGGETRRRRRLEIGEDVVLDDG